MTNVPATGIGLYRRGLSLLESSLELAPFSRASLGARSGALLTVLKNADTLRRTILGTAGRS